MNIRSEIAQIPVATADRPMPAFLALPEGERSHPAVLVIEEGFGVNTHIREVVERVAQEGYVAIAPHIYHRVTKGFGELEYDAAGIEKSLQLTSMLTYANVLDDLRATVDYVRNRPYVAGTDRVGAVGFSTGGDVAYLAACNLALSATASFYGEGIAKAALRGGPPMLTLTGGIKGKILCLFGAEDSSIPAADVDAIRGALDEHQVDHKIVVYDGAAHGFFCDRRTSYNADAEKDAWIRVKKLFAENLG